MRTLQTFGREKNQSDLIIAVISVIFGFCDSRIHLNVILVFHINAHRLLISFTCVVMTVLTMN